ncbi:Fc.00g010530.m01.CDS01 [Cosmosporella sp. VM-42]
MAVDTLSLEGKVAIVSGSGRENGIGAAIAFALARNGASVVINHVSNSTAQRAAAVSEKIREGGGRAIVVQAGIDTPEGAQKIVQETLAKFGTEHIDILVNNAGVGFPSPILDIQASDLEKTFQTNVHGPVYLTKSAIPHMPSGGRIINISSTASRAGSDILSTYGASKAALDSLTWSWALEFGRSRGITVNSLAPGPVPTDIVPVGMEDQLMGPQREMTRAADRFGAPEDIADAVLLLVSEKARWITGQYISVSGGVTGL